MSTVTKKRAGLQITSPQRMLDKFSFESEKDIDIEVTQDGILLKPKKQINELREIKKKMKDKIGLTKGFVNRICG